MVQLNSVTKYEYNQEKSLTETYDMKNLLRNAHRKNSLWEGKELVKYFRETIGPVIRFKLKRRKIQPENVPLQLHLLNTSSGIFDVKLERSHSLYKIIIHRRSPENAMKQFFSQTPLSFIESDTTPTFIVPMPTSIISFHLNSHSSD